MSFRLIQLGVPNGLGVPPYWRAYFFLLRQKKVAKEKATPGCAVSYADFPALLETPGGWLNSPAAQTTPAHSPTFPRRRQSNRRLRGNDGATGSIRLATNCCGQPGKKPNTTNQYSTTDALPGPLSGAEQRRWAGGFGLPCLSHRRVQASRPAHRVAQETGRSPAPTQGSPFLCLLSFGEAKESKPPTRQKTLPNEANN